MRNSQLVLVNRCQRHEKRLTNTYFYLQEATGNDSFNIFLFCFAFFTFRFFSPVFTVTSFQLFSGFRQGWLHTLSHGTCPSLVIVWWINPKRLQTKYLEIEKRNLSLMRKFKLSLSILFLNTPDSGCGDTPILDLLWRLQNKRLYKEKKVNSDESLARLTVDDRITKVGQGSQSLPSCGYLFLETPQKDGNPYDVR